MNEVPFLINVDGSLDVCSWAREEHGSIESRLECHGAVLLRGCTSATERQFQDLVHSFCGQAMKYVYRSTPRTNLGQNIYTATEYPAWSTIPFHCENAFQREWPLLILFFCMQPAEGGSGQTPLADINKVTDQIDLDIRRKFLDKKIMYIRNYRLDIDLPWQTVFQTESKSEVEAFCKGQDIQFEWTGDGLRTKQVCNALATHPRTGKVVWFNQAHLFHPSSLDATSRKLLSEMFSEEDFPRNATFGDGSLLDESELDHVRKVFDEEAVSFQWQKGDILLLDNMRMAHGRTPYKGKRRVLAAMGRPYSDGSAQSEAKRASR